MTRAAAPAAFPSVPHAPHVAHTLKRLLPGIFQDPVQITAAMALLHSGVDITVIALWLGHADPATTHQYLEADLAAKEAALQLLTAPAQQVTRYQAKDKLLAFLEEL